MMRQCVKKGRRRKIQDRKTLFNQIAGNTVGEKCLSDAHIPVEEQVFVFCFKSLYEIKTDPVCFAHHISGGTTGTRVFEVLSGIIIQ